MHIFWNILLKVHNQWLKRALSVISIFRYRHMELITKPLSSRVLEKLTVNLLLEKFSYIYGTWLFITMFRRIHNCAYSECNHHIIFNLFKINFNIILGSAPVLSKSCISCRFLRKVYIFLILFMHSSLPTHLVQSDHLKQIWGVQILKLFIVKFILALCSKYAHQYPIIIFP